MRTKTKYRQAFKDGGRVDDLKVDAAPETPAPDVPPLPAELPAAQEPQRQDDATLALRRQIESLRQSEQVQRQPQPMTREQRLAAWQAQGLSDAEMQFFQNHPAMLDHPELTNFAVHKAREAGFERGTEGIFAAVEKIFNANQPQAQAPAMPETPTFFEPPAQRPSRVGYSAPVSRSIPSGGSGRRSSPGRVTLSPQEIEAARVSGISIEDYAKNKIEYQRQLEAGEYRDARETQR
jgi:hypothetical protein